jgi:glycosyltransferase involved in cell wall biosynthesis
MPSFSKPTVSIIIPVHNGGADFHRCLESVVAAEPASYEIIVVADGDTDGSWRVAQEFNTHVLRIPTPEGPARARNLGAHTAKGDILFFVDADVTIPQDAIGQVAAAFEREPGRTAVFGSYDEEPFQTNFLSQYKNLFHHFVHQTASEEASTFWGACGAIRREVFLSMDGFDEGYRRPSIEDIELGYRIKKAGHKIRLLKDLQVKHLKRWTVFSLLKADFFCRAVPWTRLILNEGRFIDDLNIKISNRISVMFVYMLFLTLCGALYMPSLLVPAVLIMLLLFALNWNVYRFFLDKRGLSFTVRTIPWHWFYFFYSGMAFAFGFVEYQVKRLTGVHEAVL